MARSTAPTKVTPSRSRTEVGRSRVREVPKGMKVSRKGKLKKRSLLWRLRRFFFLVALLGIVSVSGGAYVAWSTTPLPEREPPLLQTTFICAGDVAANCGLDNSIAQLSGGVDRVTVKYEQIPPIFVQALVAAEDKEFFRHQGVDPFGIARAFWANMRNEGVPQGGSTITQQYVKNVYLSNERTLERKLREAILAIKLDKELPKQEILERYLNTIYFGRGAWGIEAASLAYFGIHVEQLGLAEASYLAGVIRSPEELDASRLPSDPHRDSQRAAATTRRKHVLDLMVQEGYITSGDRDAVNEMGWDHVLARPKSATNFGKVARPELGTEYFIEYVRHWLVKSGIVTDAAVYGGGLRVYTTLDFNAQAAAYDAIRSTLDRPGDPVASIVSIDDKGQVRAMVGGFDYAASQVNLAVGTEGGGSGRQPGSSFKPLVLADYIAQGQNLGQIYNAPAKLNLAEWPKGVSNYGDAEQGQLNVVDATKKSSNTAYAQIMADVSKKGGGPESVVAFAKQLGISAPLPAVPSLVLGTGELSVLDMASAYSTFANEGEHIGPLVVTKVTDAQGRVLWPEAGFERTRVISKEVSDTVSWVLNQVVESGTGTGARFGQPVAGKTGTTEGYRDAWFVGYTCKMTAAVWVGYDGPETKYMQGVHGINVAGGTLPATIFKKFMGKATVGLQSCAFPPTKATQNLRSSGTLPSAPGTTAVSVESPGTTLPDPGDGGGTSTSTEAPAPTTSSSSSTSVPDPSSTSSSSTTTSSTDVTLPPIPPP